jgi:hypothetical protein
LPRNCWTWTIPICCCRAGCRRPRPMAASICRWSMRWPA